MIGPVGARVPLMGAFVVGIVVGIVVAVSFTASLVVGSSVGVVVVAFPTGLLVGTLVGAVVSTNKPEFPYSRSPYPFDWQKVRLSFLVSWTNSS